jgi:DNA-binding response OmpR family regulator
MPVFRPGRPPQVPVVMLAARKVERAIVGALQFGASDYLITPFIPEELAMRIARLLPSGGPRAAIASA